MNDPQPCYFVYRMWDEDNALLYIGCTKDLPKRIVSHRGTKPWGKQIVRIFAEGPYFKDEALQRETTAIESESPLHAMSNQQVGRFAAARAIAARKAAHAAGERCASRCRQCEPPRRKRPTKATSRPKGSPTKRLIDARLDGRLEGLVIGLRTGGMGWRRVAEQVTAESGVDVSYETLRAWFPEYREAGVADTA